MARSRIDIKHEITAAFIADRVIIEQYQLTPGKTFEEEFSLTSFENTFFDALSFSYMLHEQIVEANAQNSRPQNLPNLKLAVLNYHDGLELVWKDGQFQYDLTNIADAEERKIIDRCSILESDDGELVIKIATDNNGSLEPVNAAQELRIKAYLQNIKVPGVRIRLINMEADLIETNLTVYVDPALIDLETGRLLDTAGNVFPVKDAISEYLSELEFNGAFVKDYLKAKVRSAKGIKLVTIDMMRSKFAAYPFTEFGEWKIPEAGYIKIRPENLTINYLDYGLVTN
ncbi:hypothetical protein FNO01nite_30580 [Flavobacterium noncentrifugens]|uniref:Uncharacterized protein n=1 Tax=Flavobacterium noncentrifugens TaxID=1128970 RepID=A0A1G9BWG6_9FLAO|nr:hypothetical protein [Flavobacterium noncentrifugens]GEP52386.1 hypothetical protein FNO01nite_30580 [Flavobacterium noncentrifugens]SDK43524.1 hypothetical protein SAMN04487935_3372 [Flavobacterium noncentrifugens]